MFTSPLQFKVNDLEAARFRHKRCMWQKNINKQNAMQSQIEIQVSWPFRLKSAYDVVRGAPRWVTKQKRTGLLLLQQWQGQFS